MHAPVGGSSVHPVVRVTGNFTSETPLHPAAREALLAAFDQGWADPKKLSQSSSKAAILRNQSMENIADRLGIRADEIEILGEPALGHFLSIAGLLREDLSFTYSSIDKGKVRAVARGRSNSIAELSTDSNGQIDFSLIPSDTSVLSLQLANGETGVIQNCEILKSSKLLIAVDATTSGAQVALPPRWDTALFDSQSWMGPAGLGILAIRSASEYHYPLPRIAPIRVPGSYSLPLLIASSIALENYSQADHSLRELAINLFTQVEGCSIVAPNSPALPHIFSISVEGISGENAVRELSKRNINVDSGSACSPEDLQPSHVLAAMGYETNGHLRFTIHAGTTELEMIDMVAAVKEVIAQLRS